MLHGSLAGSAACSQALLLTCLAESGPCWAIQKPQVCIFFSLPFPRPAGHGLHHRQAEVHGEEVADPD